MKRRERSYSGGKRRPTPRPTKARQTAVRPSQKPPSGGEAAGRPAAVPQRGQRVRMTVVEFEENLLLWHLDMGYVSSVHEWLRQPFVLRMMDDPEVSIHRLVEWTRSHPEALGNFMNVSAVVHLSGVNPTPPEHRGRVALVIADVINWYDTEFNGGLQPDSGGA